MTFDELAVLARSVRLPSDAKQRGLARSYFTSYRACVARLAERAPFDAFDAALSACLAYAWLPRVLRLEPGGLGTANGEVGRIGVAAPRDRFADDEEYWGYCEEDSKRSRGCPGGDSIGFPIRGPLFIRGP